MKHWFAVNTRHKFELKALYNLTRQGFCAYMPRYRKRRVHARKIDWVDAPMFPGYLFVALDLDRDIWRPVLSTIGVRSMICNSGRPLAIPDDVIREIQTREDEFGFVRMNRASKFHKGDRIKVEAGPFAGATGLFETLKDKDRVIVLLELMGQRVKVRAPLETISSYA